MEIENLSPEECRKIVAVLILTDGSARMIGKRPRISYFGHDRPVHELFISLVKRGYGLSPSYFYYRNFETSYSRQEHFPIIQDVRLYSSEGNWRNAPKANLDFLKAASSEARLLAMRAAMSADGFISVSRRKHNGTIRAQLGLACINARICSDFRKLFLTYGVETNPWNDRRTSTGLHGIQTVNRTSILSFARSIKFLNGSRIYRSQRFAGIQKNSVLDAYVRFCKSIEELPNYSNWDDVRFWQTFIKLALATDIRSERGF